MVKLQDERRIEMSETSPKNEQDIAEARSTPREELANWANEQDSWVRLLISIVIAASAPPTADQLDEIYQHLLAEKRIVNADFVDTEPLLVDALTGEKPDELQLISLADVVNVNALAEGQDLRFGPSLTLLFGQNASGKTGYARVLKRMANVRTAEEILGNARTQLDTDPPGAKVEYELNGKRRQLTWENELGLAPRMSVFDSPAVSLHLNGELGFSFTPSELTLSHHQQRNQNDSRDSACGCRKA